MFSRAVFGVSGLIIFESLVVVLFFFKRGFAAPAERLRQIIIANKSCGVEHSPANHDSDARHGIHYLKIFSNAGGEDFLVLKVPFQRNAARHDDGELDVIHKAVAGIRSEILFHNLFCGPADARG